METFNFNSLEKSDYQSSQYISKPIKEIIKQSKNTLIVSDELLRWINKELDQISQYDLDEQELILENEQQEQNQFNFNLSKNFMLQRRLEQQKKAQQTEFGFSDSFSPILEKESFSDTISDPKQSEKSSKQPLELKKQSASKKYQSIYHKGIVRQPFIKISLNRIQKLYDSLCQKKSKLTTSFQSYVMNQSDSQIKFVKVVYFEGQKISKQIMILSDSTAAEFIHKAIEEYKKDINLDQSLLQYPNFSLAYRIESSEDYLEFENIQSNKFRRPINTSRELSGEHKNEEQQIQSAGSEFYNEVPDLSINEFLEKERFIIGFESAVNCTMVILIPNEEVKNFGIELQDIRELYLHDPRKILILIEDVSIYYKLLMYPDKLIENIFEELQKITNDNFMKNKYKLQLKFNCAKFGTEEIDEKLPIEALPFPWLVIKKKHLDTRSKQHQSLQFEQSSQADISYQQDIMPSLTDKKIITESSKNFSEIFTYQEYKLIKKEQGVIYQILFGIDYFDIYIKKTQRIYKPPKGLRQRFKKTLKKIVHYLIQDVEVLEQKYKKIPISTILSIKKSTQKIRIDYSPFSEKVKQFELEPVLERISVENKDYSQVIEKENQKQIQQFNEIYNKLTFLYDKRSSLKPIKLIY